MAESKINLGEIKALSKEQRQQLAKDLRSDPELWNAVNGMGGLSEQSDRSRIQGTITLDKEPVCNARIDIFKGENLMYGVSTNQNGYFHQDLAADTYRVKIKHESFLEEISAETKAGITSTLNHNFDSEKQK